MQKKTKIELIESWKKATEKLTSYHIHIYKKNGSNNVAEKLTKQIEILFPKAIQGVYQIKTAGPHTCNNIEIEIHPEYFGDIVSWLQMNNKQDLSILIHPDTDNFLQDHLHSALWLGTPIPFNDNFVQAKKNQLKK